MSICRCKCAGNVGKGQSSGINNILAATREYHGTFRSPSLASRTKMAPAETSDVIMTRKLFFAVSQVFPERPVNICTIGLVSPSKSQFAKTICRHSLLMPPGKKTKNTLACVFTVTNVLGTWERYHRPLLIYR